MDRIASRSSRAMLKALLGTVSFVALVQNAVAQTAPAQTAQVPPQQLPEQVLVTGSLIHGAAAVGVPVTAISEQDFHEAGAVTISDVLKDVPSLNVQVSGAGTPNSGGFIVRPQNLLIHGIQTGSGNETLLLIDGIRYPGQGTGGCEIDPSIIPQLAVERVDVLADGASATYGSDAVAGVVNVVLKRGFDGAITQLYYGQSTDLGDPHIQATQLYGRKWDTGDITLSYEYDHSAAVNGGKRSYLTFDFTPWGLDNTTPISLSAPGIVSTGALVTNPTLKALGFNAANGNLACANCYSVPRGQNGVGLTWATLLANPGVNNIQNPYTLGDLLGAQDRNAATVTFDQNLFDGISFFADGFYSNRILTQRVVPGASPALQQALNAIPVPTTNPFYPAGAPAGLRVSYDLDLESPSVTHVQEVSERYHFGLQDNLPFNWVGRIQYAMSEERDIANTAGMVNVNMVSAALGNTVPGIAANGNTPAQASFTKPANVPYLNLFCDPTAFACNSPATLAYIGAFRNEGSTWQQSNVGFDFDGPLFDLPGGTLRAAIGGSYISDHYFFEEFSDYSTFDASVPLVAPDPGARNVYSLYGQLNVPVVGEANQIPLIQSLNLEVSGRYDHYSDVGSVTNPKVAGTWDVGYGLSIRGTWGKSFRAPSFNEETSVAGTMINPATIVAGAVSNLFTLNCPTVAGQPNSATAANPGSLNAWLNPTCSSNAALLAPGGIRVSGGAGIAAPIRNGPAVQPETAVNWDAGFNYSPTGFLSGLVLEATYYHIKISNLLAANTGGINVNDPAATICTSPTPGCVYIVRANPNLPITDPANAEFFKLASALVNSPKWLVDPSALTTIQFINDAAITNLGWQLFSGVDFDARYDIDFGDWGAWNTGIVGSYGLENKTEAVNGTPVINNYAGSLYGGTLKYRARLGWTGTAGAVQGLSVTGFMNFTPHSGVEALTDGGFIAPSCFWSAASSAGSCYPGSAHFGPYPASPSTIPGMYTFDVSTGYQTGDRPANPYLQNVNFQITVVDLFNKAPAFIYSTFGAKGYPQWGVYRGGKPGLQGLSPEQRFISVSITKAW
ncbi:MAG: TonB-dependent receptor [Alphaproteobacteria bacterium]|nr:TonB-dependent receptor [Alphaproteobacteria bacterium]